MDPLFVRRKCSGILYEGNTNVIKKYTNQSPGNYHSLSGILSYHGKQLHHFARMYYTCVCLYACEDHPCSWKHSTNGLEITGCGYNSRFFHSKAESEGKGVENLEVNVGYKKANDCTVSLNSD